MNVPFLPPRKETGRKRPQQRATLLEYVDRYIASRDLSPDYRELMRKRISVFVQWYGSDLLVAKLNCDLVNEWIGALLETKLSRTTIDGYRRYLRAVWFFAYENGDNDQPPLRLKKIKLPQRKIEAFSHEQLGKLLAAAASLNGFFEGNGVRRSTFWTATIHAAYSTGLRRGDLLRVKRPDIGDDGTSIVVQRKTGYRVCVRFSSEALAAIDSMHAEDDERALPWPYHENSLSIQFRELLLPAAGLTTGNFRWLRRSCASYAESTSPGAGSKALGHRSAAVFHGHYNDETISASKPVSPPPIEGKGGTV